MPPRRSSRSMSMSSGPPLPGPATPDASQEVLQVNVHVLGAPSPWSAHTTHASWHSLSPTIEEGFKGIAVPEELAEGSIWISVVSVTEVPISKVRHSLGALLLARSTTHGAFEALLPTLVVNLLLPTVRENIVRLPDLLEPLFSARTLVLI